MTSRTDAGAADWPPGSRLELWSKPQRILTTLSLVDESDEPKDSLHELIARRQKEAAERDQERPELSTWDIVKSSKEAIYHEGDDGQPIITFIQFSLNLESGYIELSRSWETVDLNPDELKGLLADAHALDVPVYANTPADEPGLMAAYESLVEDGVDVPDEDGESVRVVMTSTNPGRHVKLDALSAVHPLPPAQVARIRGALEEERSQYLSADKLLKTLRSGIDRLGEELARENRNESNLQRILTSYPLLFGLEYVRTLPKHQLGGEYEMDYALERLDGVVDLLEIEASTHRVFTKGRNPSQHLVHAEQQVLDWLEWIDSNGEYARTGPKGLSGLVRPVGYVLIGRSDDWSSGDHARLRRRNQAMSGSIRVITYDYLLDYARHVFRRLTNS
jgi:hypothetical protein